LVALPTAPLMFAAGMADGLSRTPPVETVVASVFALDICYSIVLDTPFGTMSGEMISPSRSRCAWMQ